MYRELLFILLFVFAQNISAQQIFQKTYGNLLDDWFWDLEVVNDTDIYVVGYTRENDGMNNTILFSLLNSSGSIKWNKTINIGYGDFGFKVIRLSNNSLLISGQTEDYISPGNSDALFINSDLNGNILWKKNWDGFGSQQLFNSIETIGNDLLSAGSVRYFDPQTYSGIKLMKSDMSGNLIWDKTYLFNNSALGNEVREINNEYLISGSTRILNSSDYDMLLMKADTSGNFLWGKGYGGSYEEYPAYFSMVNNEDVIMAATSFSYNNPTSNADVLIIRTDSSGNVIWSKKYGDSGHEQVKGIIQDTSGNYIVWGSTTSYPMFSGTGLVFKIDENGDLIWSNLYGRAYNEVILGLEQLHDQLLICGQIRSPVPPSNLDGYLIKTNWQGLSGCNDSIISLPYEDVIVNTYSLNETDSSEAITENLSITEQPLTIQSNILCDTITGVNETIALNSLMLYPNPNEGQFYILLPDAQPLKSLKVFNTLGQEIKYLKTFSNTIFEIRLQSYSPGLYTVNIISGENTYTLKTLIH